MNTILRYDVIGSGEPLVLLHGLASRKEAWKPQYELAKQYQLIIPDLRGHGESPVGDKPLGVPQFAKDVLDLLDELGIREFHLCGLSMGGIISQQIVAMAPKRVKSLILANTVSFVPKMLGDVFIENKVNCFMSAPVEAYTSKAAKSCVYRCDDRAMIAKVKEAVLFRSDSYMETAKSLVGINLRSSLRKVNVPTLLIGSQYDDITPVIAMVDMKRVIPKSQLVILRNAGHLSNVEVPDRFNKHVMEFLWKVRGLRKTA